MYKRETASVIFVVGSLVWFPSLGYADGSAKLENLNTSANTDTFEIEDQICGGTQKLTIGGGASGTFRFCCDRSDKGKVIVTNLSTGHSVEYFAIAPGETIRY